MGNQQQKKAIAKGTAELYFYRLQLLTEREKSDKLKSLATIKARDQEIDGLAIEIDITNYYLSSYAEDFKSKSNLLTLKSVHKMLAGECEGCEELAYQAQKLIKTIIEIRNNDTPLRQEDYIKLVPSDKTIIEIIFEPKSFFQRLKYTLSRATVEVPKFFLKILGRLVHWIMQLMVGSSMVPIVMSQFLSLRIVVKSALPVVSMFSPILGKVLELILNRIL